jgi:hypothetical protein
MSSCRSARSGKYRDNFTFWTSTGMRDLGQQNGNCGVICPRTYRYSSYDLMSRMIGTYDLEASLWLLSFWMFQFESIIKESPCHFLIRLPSLPHCLSRSLSLPPPQQFISRPFRSSLEVRNEVSQPNDNSHDVIILYYAASNKANGSSPKI